MSWMVKVNTRFMAIPAALSLTGALIVGGSAFAARPADDEPPAAEAKAAPPARQPTSDRIAQRRAEREQQEATDPRLIAEARLAVIESLLKGMTDDMRRAQLRREGITRESMLTAASARLNTELRRRPPAVAGPSHLSLALQLRSAELYELSEAHLREAMAAFESVGDRASSQGAEGWLASVLRSTGRVEESLKIHQARHDAARRPDDRRRELSFIIECLEALGRFDEAAAHYPQIIQPPNPNAALSSRRTGSPYQTRARFGRALLESGNLAEAEKVFRGALLAASETQHQESSAVLAMHAALAMALSLQGREDEHEARRAHIVSGAQFFADVGRIDNWEWLGRYLAHVGEYELAAWYLENGTARVPADDQHSAEYRSDLALLEKVREALAKSAETAALPLSSRRGD